MSSVDRRPAPVALAATALLGLAILLPFGIGLVSSLLPISEVMARSPQWSLVTLDNYARVFAGYPFGRYLVNSAIIAAVSTAGTMATSILAAYAFARMEFRGRGVLFALVIGAIMIPNIISIVPNYLFMARLNLIPGYWAAILPALASGFVTFFLRQHFRAIPLAYDEAARMDGAGRLRILFDVVVPIARPAIASMTLFAFIAEWNAYLWPRIVLNGAWRTVEVGLADLQSYEREQPFTDWPLILAASMVALAPGLVAFVFAERHLSKGAGLGGLK
jgi:multiple sugar transport system permease protein/sn-glycerol 3-phosphate transport system permease protein